MCSAPLTVSGGVSMEKTSPRCLVRSNLYYTRLFPPARPLLLNAVKRRLARHQAGVPRVRAAGAGIGAHGIQRTASRRWAGATTGRDGMCLGTDSAGKPG